LFLRHRTNRRISRSNSAICLFSKSTNSAVSIHCFYGIRHSAPFDGWLLSAPAPLVISSTVVSNPLPIGRIQSVCVCV
jgi:hypothetical protein